MRRRSLLRQYPKVAFPSSHGRDPARPLRLGEGGSFRDIVDSPGRTVRYGRRRERGGDVLDVTARRSPPGYALLEQDRLPAIGDALDDRVKAAEPVAGTIDHRQPQH